MFKVLKFCQLNASCHSTLFLSVNNWFNYEIFFAHFQFRNMHFTKFVEGRNYYVIALNKLKCCLMTCSESYQRTYYVITKHILKIISYV